MTKAASSDDPPHGNEDAQRRPGMKLLRLWVPDPSAPGFAEEAKRQGRLLRGRPEEVEALAFIEAVGWPED